jgi:hypothetical protein
LHVLRARLLRRLLHRRNSASVGPTDPHLRRDWTGPHLRRDWTGPHLRTAALTHAQPHTDCAGASGGRRGRAARDADSGTHK